MTPILIIPGYQNSGEGHWQSLWEAALPGSRRVEMPNWDYPVPAEWAEALEDAVTRCAEPPLLVGHSLGCIAIVRWAAVSARQIRGALLAAPADVERAGALPQLRAFAPIPRRSLLFPSILAVSSNDPFLALDRARSLASDWGSRLVELGPCGHLNTASGFGPWLRGEALLEELR